MFENEGKRPVVLLVEDEPLVLMDTVEMVRDAGYDVISAPNADKAIDILESRTDIRVVVTDVNMPGSMDGLKLAHAVRGRWPPVEIIVVSALHLSGPLPKRGLFFLKPYDPIELLGAIHEFTV